MGCRWNSHSNKKPLLPRARLLPGSDILPRDRQTSPVLRLQPDHSMHCDYCYVDVRIHPTIGKRGEDLNGHHRAAVTLRIPANGLREDASNVRDTAIDR